MDRPQLIRRLRIAVSVFFGLLTVALCVLWVRSYWTRDNWDLNFSRNRGFCLESALGQFAVRTYPTPTISNSFDGKLIYWGCCPTEIDPCHPANNTHGFDAYFDQGYVGFVVPHWLLLVAAVACLYRYYEPIPCWRFSLRTLLIATTLFAVVLGLVVWMAG